MQNLPWTKRSLALKSLEDMEESFLKENHCLHPYAIEQHVIFQILYLNSNIQWQKGR